MDTPRHDFKMRTCEVCGREYRVFPHMTSNGAIRYDGACCYCGAKETCGWHGVKRLSFEEYDN